jgi:Peptidase family M1 domain
MNLPSRTALLTSVLFCAGHAAAQLERPVPYPIPHGDSWKAAVAKQTRTDTGVPGAKYWTNYARYSIQAELIPETAILKGHIDMTYVNRSPRAITDLRVHLRQNLYKAGSLRNRFVEITGGVTISEVQFNGEDLSRNSYRVSGTVMSIRRLPERIPAGGEGTLSMDWEFKVPGAGRSAPRGVSVVRQGQDSHHVFYLGYWYPQFAVREDVAGWVAEQYMSNAEFYMGYADYDLKFTAPSGWLVRATGTLENGDKILTKTALARLKKARESREIVQIIDKDDLDAGKVTRKTSKKKHTWHFKSERVRDIAVSASDEYVWDASHAVVNAAKDKCMIHSVYKPRGRFTGRSTKVARQTIEYMSKNVYPYPWPHMTACEGIIGGGMEYPMMTICGRLGDGVVTHELIHMWFPMLIGSNEKARAWQDEGFTSFFTERCQAAYRGREASLRLMSGMFLRSLKAPMMRHGDLYGGGRSAYAGVSYMKTSAVLKQLQLMLGDEVFFEAFRQYAKDWAFKHPYPKDFFNTFSAVSGRDLDWYFRVWFYETWSLDQAVESVEEKEDGAHVVIADRSKGTYPTQVRVTYEDDTTEMKTIDVKHWLAGKKTKTLIFKNGVAKVVIDPKRITLDASRRNNTWRKQ